MDDVKSLIQEKNWDELFEGDQLKKQREENKVTLAGHFDIVYLKGPNC